MTLLNRFFLVHMLAAVAAFAFAFARIQLLFVSLIVVVLGLMWFAAFLRGMHALGGLMLNLLAFSSVPALLVGAPGWLVLVGAVAALGAWDLGHFIERLSAVERVEFASGIGKQHLIRLSLVEGLGLLLGLAALTLQARVSFWWEVLLVVLVVIGLSRLVAFVRRETED